MNNTQQEVPRLRTDVPQLNHLCETCSSRFPSDSPWPSFLEFLSTEDLDGVSLGENSLLQLHKSAERGCHLCTLLLEAILPERMTIGLEHDEDLMAKTSFQLRMLPDSGGWVLRIQHLPSGNVKDLVLKPVLASAGMQADRRVWSLEPSIGTRMRLIAIQSQSNTNIHPLMIQQMKEWLRVCLEKHTECQRTELADKMVESPTLRLVDVGVGAGSCIHLVDVDSNAETREYITLSYRWSAETKRTSLKTSNKNEYYESIPTRNWPQTYGDALSIARQLDVRYIWIDSLCIVQDDEKDWEEQAAQMDAIYTNGLLNLAGVEGSRSPGLARGRNPLRVSPCRLTSQCSASDMTGASWLCFRPDDFEKSVDKASLYERGWTFQERVLSKRTVHFGDQLFWECACLRASEAFPLGTDHPNHVEADNAILRIKTELRTRPGPLKLSQNVPATGLVAFQSLVVPDVRETTQMLTSAASKLQSPSQELPFSSDAQLHRLWSTVIRCYSKAKLTEASDRLVALKGIANSISQSFGLSRNDYVAGLWKPCLAHQLLWAREGSCYTDEDRKLASCLTKQFPSWSWASCSGETRFISIHFTLSRSFIKFGYDYASEDSDRTPDPALLVLRGQLIPCKEIRRLIELAPTCLQHSVAVRTADAISNNTLQASVELDRPVVNVPSRVDLLPVLQPLGSPVAGLVLHFRGLSMSSRVYSRLGVYYCDATPLQNLSGCQSDVGLSEDLEAIPQTELSFHLV